MTHSTTTGPSKAQREADARAARRAEQASIVAGLQSVLESHEQLLGFARGRIAGGIRGMLNVGPEAFFAPFVNIGLTERRVVLQHIRPENGKPATILPHSFLLSEITSIGFADIETYGGEPACRLTLRLENELYCRLRLQGALNFESAQALATVFTTLTSSRRSEPAPTRRTCPHCVQTLDQPYRFCPYCGGAQPEPEIPPTVAEETSETTGESDAAPLWVVDIPEADEAPLWVVESPEPVAAEENAEEAEAPLWVVESVESVSEEAPLWVVETTEPTAEEAPLWVVEISEPIVAQESETAPGAEAENTEREASEAGEPEADAAPAPHPEENPEPHHAPEPGEE